MEKPIRITKEKLNIYTMINLSMLGLLDAMDVLQYLDIIKKNKGMTKEEAERMQEMYQLRYI